MTKEPRFGLLFGSVYAALVLWMVNIVPLPFPRYANSVTLVLGGLCVLFSAFWLLQIFQYHRLHALDIRPLRLPKKLPLDGVYAKRRHPLLTAILLLLFGEVLLFGASPVAFLVLALFGLWLQFAFAKKRALALSKHFPDTYPAYHKARRGFF